MIHTSISVVIGSYNRLPYLKPTIASVRKELKDTQYEIIVVDGGSTDGALTWLLKQKDITTIVQHNRGKWNGKAIVRKSWGYFMNLGFKCAQGKYICMLSDDCLVVPGAILNGVKLFEKKLSGGEKIGAMAFYWRNWPEETRYKVGLALGGKMFVNHGLYLKSALDDVGYIDENAYVFYHADGDLCLKMWQKGYACIDSPDSFIEHYGHANRAVRVSNQKQTDTDWENYVKKWSDFYDVKVDHTGWTEKEYVDPLDTASIFRQNNPLNYFIFITVKNLLLRLGLFTLVRRNVR